MGYRGLCKMPCGTEMIGRLSDSMFEILSVESVHVRKRAWDWEVQPLINDPKY